MKVFRSTDGKLRFTAGTKEGGQYAPDVHKNFQQLQKLKKLHTPTIQEILGFTLDDLNKAEKDGHVFKNTHPKYPYSIYKYSQNTVYNQNWNNITLTTRGLIVNHDTGELISRPFKKFFNHNEPSLNMKLLKGEHYVYEKLDGSLGISYLTPEGNLNIATMGSFTSEQAQTGNQIYSNKHAHSWNPNPHITYLWEIIYPDNRIVVNYGEKTDLILLGGVNKTTGETLTADMLPEWKGETVPHYPDQKYNMLLNSESRKNSEGFVIFFPKTNTHVKIKHEEYVTLHRIRTGLTETKIWENMLNPQTDEKTYYETMPEEFHSFYNNTKHKLIEDYNTVINTVKKQYNTVVASLPAGYSQKDFADMILNSSEYKNNAALLFQHHKNPLTYYTVGVTPNKTIWSRVKPKHNQQSLF